MRPDTSMSDLLLELAAAGWRPVVHPKTESIGTGPVAGWWVAYPESSVREFFIGEGEDPADAVRALHRFAFGPREVAAPALTAEEALEAREARLRAAQAMGWVGGVA